LNAGMTIEIFTVRNVLHPPPGFNRGMGCRRDLNFPRAFSGRCFLLWPC
jgi:hypothetical protein